MDSAPNRLKEFRKERGLTALELADMVGVRETTIYRYEAGGVTPSELARRALSRVLGVPVDELFPPLEIEGAASA